MAGIRFEWDPHKAQKNAQKHGVTFEEAKTVFIDENALFLSDADETDEEDRFVLLGLSATLRLLVVSHCFRESNDVIRIISARKANAKEQHIYVERWSE